ncbi:MAG: four helix bundle protein [Saprospiraceae bacterium]
MRNFRELEVWQLGMQLAIDIYPCTETWPDIHRFRLTAQILASSSAIPTNIAEGCSRSSDRDFKRYLEYALGEAFEFETQTLIAHAYKLLSAEECREFVDQVQLIQRKVAAFIQSLS